MPPFALYITITVAAWGDVFGEALDGCEVFAGLPETGGTALPGLDAPVVGVFCGSVAPCDCVDVPPVGNASVCDEPCSDAPGVMEDDSPVLDVSSGVFSFALHPNKDIASNAAIKNASTFFMFFTPFCPATIEIIYLAPHFTFKWKKCQE